ncbi:hypothetical protein SMSRO_SF029690 [Spiroplasma poulsonii]|uniref:Uncharacterized protein n=1 Tax=Spiroplasma poulsonii TaxID=2138 RepID=A0A2P6F8M5_9MOLU|nr:hypothetical protein SMSRO_SF029690 [Spiroplasma poulsonii]
MKNKWTWQKNLKEEEGCEIGLYRYSLNYEVDLFNYEPF